MTNAQAALIAAASCSWRGGPSNPTIEDVEERAEAFLRWLDRKSSIV